MTMIDQAAEAARKESDDWVRRHPNTWSVAAPLSVGIRAALKNLREQTMVVRDPRDGGVIHEIRGAPDDIWKMCLDAILEAKTLNSQGG